MSYYPESVNSEIIREKIVKEQFHVFPDTAVTVCCITLKSGFSVIGHSACVSKDNYEPETGKKIAYANAFERIWELEGYLLKEMHHEAKLEK